MTNKKRILIGMSGGIDSTVAAILLLEQGYELVGATFRTFDPCDHLENKGCGSEDSVMAAQALAQSLGIEHHILDFRETFRKHVIANFIDEYAHGRTPNPCVMCNKLIKFGAFPKAIKKLGIEFDKFATGHYARNDFNEKTGRYELKKGINPKKDQTYFLYRLSQEELSNILFPLGAMQKEEIR
jgi:tRNA-specific 2-thiouridylase